VAVVEEEERYKFAKARVEEIKGFYIHLGVYLIVNLGLFTINMITNPDALWFYWPLLGWGIGLVIHLFSLVMEGGLFGPRWESKKIQELMQKR
jgi:hypothetical protein